MREREREAYRNYVADCLKATAGAKVRLFDIVHPAPEIDAEAVVDEVISRAGLEVR